MRNLLVIIGFCTLSAACSNPFSGQRPPILQENTKPQNTSCSDVRFDQSEFSIKQFRAIIHCLNQSNELKEIEEWSNNISDLEIQPWLSAFNSLLKNEPQYLYSLKKAYENERSNGELQKLINDLFLKISTPEQKSELIEFLKKHSAWLENFIASQQYQLNTGNLSLITEVKSFKRGAQEQIETGNLDAIISAFQKYLTQKDSISLPELFQLFALTDGKYISSTDDSTKIAGMITWLIDENRLFVFSDAAISLTTKPIICFGRDKPIDNPLRELLSELSKINSEELPTFLNKKIPSLLMLGQGYCNIPTEVVSASKLLQEATDQESLVTFFSFLKPVIRDEKFITLLSSKAFADLAKDLSHLKKSHLIQDLVSFINWSNRNPISENNTSSLLDSFVKEFSKDEIQYLIRLIPNDPNFLKTIDHIAKTLPKTNNKKSLEKNWIGLFTKKSFIPALTLISEMNEKDKIFPIFDRIIDLFKKFLDQGKSLYQEPKVFLAIHSNKTTSQNWELPIDLKKRSKNLTDAACASLPIDFNLFKLTSETPISTYIHSLDQISLCYGVNQSFLSVKDLATYLASQDLKVNHFNAFSDLQHELISFAFSLNSNQAFSSFNLMIHLNPNDLSQVHQLIQSSSALLEATKPVLEVATETKKLIAKYLSDQETYQALNSSQDSKYDNTIDDPSRVSTKLIQITNNALPSLFQKFCPDLDINSPTCDIDPDQVLLYKRSAQALSEQMTKEYLSSSQNWIHPLEFDHWIYNDDHSKRANTFNFHFNPLIKQIDHQPNSLKSVFDFLELNANSKLDVFTYLQNKSNSISVIPYIYQTSLFPESNQEYHQLIRLRMISDLDRLELLAINSDFEPFGIMRNFGLNFIREIATAWGDVPSSKRPKLGTSETLKEASENILYEFNKFDLAILQKTGSCDPRGKNRLGRWFQNRFCGGEISNIRARIFNLKYMLSILKDQEELALLRDLFYSLYKNNNTEQLGVYNNGVNDYDQNSKIDLLEIVPKLARLGLLHQVGISILNENSTSTKATLSILSHSEELKTSSKISNFLVSNHGQVLIRNIISLASQLRPEESKNISALLLNLSKINHQQWLLFIISLADQQPDLFSSLLPTIHQFLQKSKVVPLSHEMTDLLSKFSSDLNHEKLVSETSALLTIVSKNPNAISSMLDFKLSEDFIKPWLTLLSSTDSQKQRDQISEFITGKGLVQLCDVFSDAVLTEKAYKILESSNQNNGVIELLEECRLFLH